MIYSNDIFNNKPEEIKSIFKDLFEFCHVDILFENLKISAYKLKEELEINDIKILFNKLHEAYPTTTNSIIKESIITIYKEYLFKLSKNISSFEGPFIDFDYQFVNPEDAYYLSTENKNEIIEKRILKNYKKLLVPK